MKRVAGYWLAPGDWFGEYRGAGQRRHLKRIRRRARRRQRWQ